MTDTKVVFRRPLTTAEMERIFATIDEHAGPDACIWAIVATFLEMGVDLREPGDEISPADYQIPSHQAQEILDHMLLRAEKVERVFVLGPWLNKGPSTYEEPPGA